MKEIEKLDYISFALVNGIIQAILAFFLAILQTAALGSVAGMMGMAGAGLIGVGIVSIILSPILGFILGFIGGLIFAALYNFVINRIAKIKAE